MKAKKVFEYMEVHPEHGLGVDETFDDVSFEELIEVIDNTAGQDFTPEDFRNMLDWAIEERIDPEAFTNAFKHLANVHPHIQQDFTEEGGPFRDLLEAYLEMTQQFYGGPRRPDPRMN